ncbi:MAG TPA: cell division protein FtsQ/DivIB [Armatimonadota bacterium]|nr:cell division protein FtsQ/DivIB [Armatimonadota bacterium]
MVALDATHRPALGAVRAGGPGLLWRLRLAAGLALALLAVELVSVVLTSPRLAVRGVTVRGGPPIAALAAAKIRLPANTNVLRAPLALVKQQAESAPAVREARVSRAFPNGLVVTVERREAIAVIRGAKRAILVDPEGVAFTVPEEWGWGLPELVGPHLGGDGVEAEAASSEIEALLAVLRALGSDPRLRVTRLQIGKDEQIEITLASAARVNLGKGQGLAVKAKLLAAAIDQIGADRMARLDLAEPTAAFWEPRGNVVAARVR